MSEQLIGQPLMHRDWRVLVHGITEDGKFDLEYEFIGLDIAFEFYKTLRAEPNKGSLTLYNLTSDQRKSIERLNLYDPKKIKGSTKRAAGRTAKTGKSGAPRKPKVGRISVEVEAGYETTSRSLIARMDLRRAITTKDGATFVTKIEGEDGGRSVLASRINESFPPGTTLETVVRACADALGVGTGNVVAFQSLLAPVFTHGCVCAGSAAKELSGVLRRAGLIYSIQAGVLQLRPTTVDTTAVVNAYVLNERSGLVGIPERDASGTVTARTLMLPSLAPGGFVTLESADFLGTYEVIAGKYVGQSRGNDWNIDLELRPV